ncbi:multiple copy protein PGV_MIGE [Phaeocystis globosa virus PgV-16T]|uniref:Multiple copy protein PGV_MIGE n=1 Tax=Phaeocystis globosa virus PgV-16T TaxID=3071227 RepID=A0AC59EXN9_9VIRU|nr:multiple copy protein PGV_MIGE [Phaeocystis globosa virus]AGM15681.1 multiple copy protein PGV_MIGE [Phaeocystis globosa virus PgV-16T]
MTSSVPDSSKSSKIFYCECCEYSTSRKSQYDRHLTTLKHKNKEMVQNGYIKVPNGYIKVPNEIYECVCGKKYKFRQGLFRHQKTCDNNEPVCVEIKKSTDVSGDMVAILMEQLDKKDKQLDKKDKQMMEQLEKHTKESKEQIELLTNTINDMIPKMGNNITNNNQFNINMFLNEECKDAINMSDFIKSIQVSVEQLQYTTNNGLEKGITKVIMENMNKLSKYERPLHCSDVKRETLYIKDNDKWEKDTNKEKIKKAIKKASGKNYIALTEWTKDNPKFMKQDDKQLFYARSMSAMGKPLDGLEDKIIKSICKDNQAKD